MTNPSVPKLDRSALLGILAQQSDDVLAELMGKVAQAAIDAQFDEFIGAEHYERSADRKDRRNGFRERTVDTRMGSIDLRIPRAREGNFVPPLVEHRKRSERALVAAVQEMFVSGVSTRKDRKGAARARRRPHVQVASQRPVRRAGCSGSGLPRTPVGIGLSVSDA